jgi:Protein of unknown function (DUF5672)
VATNAQASSIGVGTTDWQAMKKQPNCAVLIPIYKNQLDEDELFSVKTSLSNLHGHDIYWVAPKGLDLSYYDQKFGVITPRFFDTCYFKDIAGYNKLLTSPFFYENFIDYEFCLICQPDAIVLKPELHMWLENSYDYIGAPWPNGYSLKIKTERIPIPEGITCTAFVGNGGLSLRRNQACINLLNEFDDVAETWRTEGHAEDLFFGFIPSLSEKFSVPSLMTAAHFAHDIEPQYLHKLTGGVAPFGVHAWSKYDRQHWMNIFLEMNYA